MGRPNFSEDFKREAVQEITVRGYVVREVSERLGVSTYSLYKWMNLYPKAASQTSSADHEAENRRLKRELLFTKRSSRPFVCALKRARLRTHKAG